MSKPENWDGRGYPEHSPKVWISFASGQAGNTLVLVSELRRADPSGDYPKEINIYRAVEGGWPSRAEAEDAANDLATKAIEQHSL